MIYVLHVKRTGDKTRNNHYLGNIHYLGRPYSVLQNWYSHLPYSRAKFQVETVEEAVACYRRDFYKEIALGNPRILDALEDLIVEYIGRGVLYLSCWCKDDLDPRESDHCCHCDVIREYIAIEVMLRRLRSEIVRGLNNEI